MSIVGNFFGNMGYYNQMRNQNAKAEELYGKGMRLGGMSAKNEGAYGVLLLKKGYFEQAAELFDRALKKRDCSKQLHSLIRINRAVAWFRLGRIDESVGELEKLHKTFKCTRVYQTLGYVYTAAGMFDKAEPYNLEAVEYDGEDGVSLDNTGQMYIEMGDYEKARGYIERAYAKKHFSDALYHMGILAEHDYKPREALEYYREARSKNIDALNDVTREKLDARIAEIKGKLGITEEEDED